jgi:FkbM family methyltransferase
MKFYSQFGQDKYCYETFFKNKKSGVFIEIGADDGIDKSNTYFFEKYLNWSGICIEPRKNAYDNLIKNRKCVCINNAISLKDDQTVKFLDIKGYGKGLSGIINNYDPRHVKRINYEVRHKDNKGHEIVDVNTKTLMNILNKHNINHIDFMSIDIEGNELEIIKSIDLDKIFIDVITIENNYNDNSIITFFNDNNYKLVKKLGCDEIYKKDK